MYARLLAGACAVAALGACSGGDKIVGASEEGGQNPPPGNSALTSEDSVFIANLVASEAISNFKNMRTMPITQVAAMAGAATPQGCNPTLTGTADTNGNGIPEDQTITFTQQNCSITQQGITGRLTGSVRVQDIGGLRGFRVTYNSLTTTAISADTTATILVNGVLEIQWISATAGRTLSTLSTRIAAQRPNGSASMTFAPNVTSQFTTTGGQIAVGRNLPAGTYTMTGTLVVSYEASGNLRPAGSPAQASYTTNINTATTLTYDGTCTHDRAFGAGQLRGSVTGFANGSLATSFNGCGSGQTPPPGVKR
jgi:hypothetical protein